MQDRNVEFPNRFRMVKVEGTDDIYDVIPAPGEVLNPGTLLNKANLLTDETAAALGLGLANPTIDDAFNRTVVPSAGTGTLYVHCKDEAGRPVTNCVVQIGDVLAVTPASGAAKYFLAPGTHSATIRSPIDYGAGVQTVNVNLALGEIAAVEVTILDTTGGVNEVDITTAATNLMFSDRVTRADVFAVGAGGSGAVAYWSSSNTFRGAAASGGAGGNTKTVKDINIRERFAVTIGSGGTSVEHTSSSSTNGAGKAGGTTTVKDSGGAVVASAPGGNGGTAVTGTNAGSSMYGAIAVAGANGGSGSGGATPGGSESETPKIGISGSDGSNGGDVTSDYGTVGKGGTGQGTTTRAFGDPNGELFSSAGGSAASLITSFNETGYKGAIGAVADGGGNGATLGGKQSTVKTVTASGGSRPGCGGGAVAVAMYSSGSLPKTKSGAGANGLVRFRWEVSA